MLFRFSLLQKGLMHGPPGPQLPHRDPLPPHQPMHQHQHHHRQELLHREQQQQNVSELRPVMLQGQNLFQQQQHGRQMNSRPQNLQQRTMANRQRMVRHFLSSTSLITSNAETVRDNKSLFSIELSSTHLEADAATQQQPTGTPHSTWQHKHEQFPPRGQREACCQGNTGCAS